MHKHGCGKHTSRYAPFPPMHSFLLQGPKSHARTILQRLAVLTFTTLLRADVPWPPSALLRTFTIGPKRCCRRVGSHCWSSTSARDSSCFYAGRGTLWMVLSCIGAVPYCRDLEMVGIR